jgi:hypothetical protein
MRPCSYLERSSPEDGSVESSSGGLPVHLSAATGEGRVALAMIPTVAKMAGRLTRDRDARKIWSEIFLLWKVMLDFSHSEDFSQKAPFPDKTTVL